MQPSYDELYEMTRVLSRDNAQLREVIRCLQQKVQELQERLNLNSDNSSKPSSTDQKRNKQAPHGGAVKGHSGHHRSMVPPEQISRIVMSSLKHCAHCGCGVLKKCASQIFQQVELPEIQPIVTQIELEKATCSRCGKNLTAPFPPDYDRSSFGSRLISFIGLCSSVYRMSKRTVQTLLKTFCNIHISLDSIPAMERKVSKGLQSAYDVLATRAKESRVAYVDETTFRQSAKTHYVWTVTTKNEAFIRILSTRGLDSLAKVRPRENKNITVTDRYQVYSYGKQQYCLAHIYRDFKRFSQRDGPDGDFGKRAVFELAEIFKACHLTDRREMQIRVWYRKRRLETILYDVMANGSDKMSRFAERLLDRFPKVFLFTKYAEVECTNNPAERTLRHIVLWRKTSYGTQSDAGSRFLERAITVWMTLKKQGREVFSFFHQAYQATFNPAILSPSI